MGPGRAPRVCPARLCLRRLLSQARWFQARSAGSRGKGAGGLLVPTWSPEGQLRLGEPRRNGQMQPRTGGEVLMDRKSRWPFGSPGVESSPTPISSFFPLLRKRPEPTHQPQFLSKRSQQVLADMAPLSHPFKTAPALLKQACEAEIQQGWLPSLTFRSEMLAWLDFCCFC